MGAGQQTHCTSRMLLRPLLDKDISSLFEFMSDAQAMRHTYIASSIEMCAARLNTFETMRARLGFAPWVVQSATAGHVIGWGGLCVDPDQPEWGLEVVYAFSPDNWGHGYATELVRYSLAYAFDQLAAPEDHTLVATENVQSIRVLQKCGFNMLRYEPSLVRNHYHVRAASAA